MPPFGAVLVLERPAGATQVEHESIWECLRQYCDGQLPYVGLIVDLTGTDYRFASADLGGVLSAIAGRRRGWVAPCAVALAGSAGADLRKLFALTKVDSITQLRVVDDRAEGMAHVRQHLQELQDSRGGPETDGPASGKPL